MRYWHIIEAMRPGDSIYLVRSRKDMDKAIHASACRAGIKVSTSRAIALHAMDPNTACDLVKVTRLVRRFVKRTRVDT